MFPEQWEGDPGLRPIENGRRLRFTPDLVSRCLAVPPSWSSRAAMRCTGSMNWCSLPHSEGLGIRQGHLEFGSQFVHAHVNAPQKFELPNKWGLRAGVSTRFGLYNGKITAPCNHGCRAAVERL